MSQMRDAMSIGQCRVKSVKNIASRYIGGGRLRITWMCWYNEGSLYLKALRKRLYTRDIWPELVMKECVDWEG